MEDLDMVLIAETALYSWPSAGATEVCRKANICEMAHIEANWVYVWCHLKYLRM